MSELQQVRMASAEHWSAWIAAEPPDSPGCWLVIAKKGNPTPSVTKVEAIEVALCHGWIDSQVGRLDEAWYLSKFTPRRPRSMWSQVNRATVERLEAAGRLLPRGVAEIEQAKADGRWDAAYAGARTAVVPPDLQAALAAEPQALQHFVALDSNNRYAVIFRVNEAKRAETRARRIADFVVMLSEGRSLHPPRQRRGDAGGGPSA